MLHLLIKYAYSRVITVEFITYTGDKSTQYDRRKYSFATLIFQENRFLIRFLWIEVLNYHERNYFSPQNVSQPSFPLKKMTDYLLSSFLSFILR